MTDSGIERRLAAILAADVAGYSRFMRADEEGTLARLKAARGRRGSGHPVEFRPHRENHGRRLQHYEKTLDSYALRLSRAEQEIDDAADTARGNFRA